MSLLLSDGDTYTGGDLEIQVGNLADFFHVLPDFTIPLIHRPWRREFLFQGSKDLR